MGIAVLACSQFLSFQRQVGVEAHLVGLMAKKDKFVVEFTPLSAPQFQKDCRPLLNSWADHVVCKTIKKVRDEIQRSIVDLGTADDQARKEAVARVHLVLDRNIQRIQQGVYTYDLTCAQQKGR